MRRPLPFLALHLMLGPGRPHGYLMRTRLGCGLHTIGEREEPMRRRRGIAAAVAAFFVLAAPAAAQAPGGTPGADGVGDPYFPQEGNGGYDVRNYDLTLGYDPESDHLDGLARIRAQA